MNLPDRLQCPHCKGRLIVASADALHCAVCERTIPIMDGIADFTAVQPAGVGSTQDRISARQHPADMADPFVPILAAAGDRWPASLGDTLQFGCGRGETSHTIVAEQGFHSLLVLDSETEMLQSCRRRIGARAHDADHPVAYARLDAGLTAIRDVVADTVIATGLLAGIGDVRGFLASVYRVLKPGGRAAFVVPNRRYHEAMCRAIAQALVQWRARDGAWPPGQEVALAIVAQTRRLLVHRGDPGFLSGLPDKHLFDSEWLEDVGTEVGFATAEMIPLQPDPVGTDTISRMCRSAGAPDSFTETVGELAAAAGRPFFNLLARQDTAASMLLWLTKGPGPSVRTFTDRQSPQPVRFGLAQAALGGLAPRWSVELSARDTPNGIIVSLGGWCLCNADVRWVRLTLDDVTRCAPVWRPRPDVQDVLNRHGLYHPLNALCSGLTGEILFGGVHPNDNVCAFRLEVVLIDGLVLTGPAPERLSMNEKVVIAH